MKHEQQVVIKCWVPILAVLISVNISFRLEGIHIIYVPDG
jgi:hypothetical protein